MMMSLKGSNSNTLKIEVTLLQEQETLTLQISQICTKKLLVPSVEHHIHMNGVPWDTIMHS